jgi:hypothetical protein
MIVSTAVEVEVDLSVQGRHAPQPTGGIEEPLGGRLGASAAEGRGHSGGIQARRCGRGVVR